MTYDPQQFAEKFHLARQTAMEVDPNGGICGFEIEFNLLNQDLEPLDSVGSGPAQQSFIDFLRDEFFADWLKPYCQMEVFNWMIEWATRPYYSLEGAVYETRLLEGAMINALSRASRKFGEPIQYWHGNLLRPVEVGSHSIPRSWQIAKRRYLQRCVDLFGPALATSGIHTNLSLPEPLLTWDFLHLSPEARSQYNGSGSLPGHLDDYKNQVYITLSRLLRAFAALFTATSASTPLQGTPEGISLTDHDSVRNLTFPNPAALDLPLLYRSHRDYLEHSYDLVQRGIRFGNNNWVPVRARSFVEPVERLIQTTSGQLSDLYARGLYAGVQSDATQNMEEMARQIEIANLLARIDLPMARVEIRTDEGGHSMPLDLANLTFKYLLMLHLYADPDFARAFRYDREDIERARRNEHLAAESGLRAEIENPFTGKPVGLRQFLGWTLEHVMPLAQALGWQENLQPLVEMAADGENTAGQLRQRIRSNPSGSALVNPHVIRELVAERQAAVAADVQRIVTNLPPFAPDRERLEDFILHARAETLADPSAPVLFRPDPAIRLGISYPDKTAEIIDLSSQLVRIPSVTACPVERLDEVRKAATFIYEFLIDFGLDVRLFNHAKYPALFAAFPGEPQESPVLLSGHFDVVSPEPDDSQFEPRIEGDYLWGRGAADMKTVVATYLVWMKDTLRQGPPYPPVQLLLVGNEENGEGEPFGTPHVLRALHSEGKSPPGLFIAGERTGERGSELWGEVCTQSRGLMRVELCAQADRGHTGVGSAKADLLDRLLAARESLVNLFEQHLTMNSADGWQSAARFSYLQVGEPGVFNISAGEALLGVEIRPIPQDDLNTLSGVLETFCREQGLAFKITVRENGIICAANNLQLQCLLSAVRDLSGSEPRLGRKLPGTSARFAPGGQGVVWGQSGIGPHSREERHFIPSIEPYRQALDAFARNLKSSKPC